MHPSAPSFTLTRTRSSLALCPHQCFICGDMGKDHVVGGVHKCLKPYCGKFYHQHCADQMRTAEIFKKQDEVRHMQKSSLM